MDNFKLINRTNRFYVHEDGYVFKLEKNYRKKVEIPIQVIRGKPKVRVQNKKLNLVLLMLQYFGDNEYPHDIGYTYKIVNDRLPLKNINVRFKENFDSKEEKIIFDYKCFEKASSHNSRVKQETQITTLDVLNTLKRNDFKCQYCNSKLNSKTWHLDHVHPISNGGQNVNTNITCACKACNLMKGALGLNKFLHQVKLIALNYNLIND